MTLETLEWTDWGLPSSRMPTLSIFSLSTDPHATRPNLDVIGAGYWVRLGCGGDQGEAVVIQHRSDGSHWRASCSIGEALPYLARTLQAKGASLDDLLEMLATVIGPVETIRFAASIA